MLRVLFYPFYLWAMKLYHYDKDYEKALAFYEKAKIFHPKHAKNHFKIAMCYYKNRDYDTAILHIKNALELQDNSHWKRQLATAATKATAAKFSLFVKNPSYFASIENATKALQKDKKPRYYLDLAADYLALSNFKAAAANYEEAIKLLKDNASLKKAYYELGFCYEAMVLSELSLEKLNAREKAELLSLSQEAYLNAINLDKKSQKPQNLQRFGIGLLHEQNQRYKWAKRAYVNLLKEQAGLKVGLLKFASMSDLLALKKAVDLDDELLFKLGFLYERCLEFKEAILCYECALNMNYQRAFTHYRLALCLYQMNEVEKSVNFFKEALNRTSDYRGEWHKNLALAYERLGEKELALKEYLQSNDYAYAGGGVKISANVRKLYKEDKNFAKRVVYTHFYENEPILEKHILYEVFHGRLMSCNPYAIFKAILNDERFKDYTHIWVLSSADFIPKEFKTLKNLILVRKESHLYLRYLASAKYLINNTTFPYYFIRRKDQLYLNTWHGTALKCLGKFIQTKFMEHDNTQRNFLQVSHFANPSLFMQDVLLKDYDVAELFSGKALISGYARIDLTLKVARENEFIVRGALGENLSENSSENSQNLQNGVNFMDSSLLAKARNDKVGENSQDTVNLNEISQDTTRDSSFASQTRNDKDTVNLKANSNENSTNSQAAVNFNTNSNPQYRFKNYDTQNTAQRLRERFGIKDYEKVLLYAPTYRGYFGDANFEYEKISSLLKILSLTPFKVLFKGHHETLKYIEIEKDRVCDANDRDIDTNELLGIVDILITDYSSIAFDYMILDKPIIYYCYDYEEYKKERGIYFDLEDLGLSYVKTVDEILSLLNDESFLNAKNRYSHLKDSFLPFEDGLATKRVIEFFFFDNCDKAYLYDANVDKSYEEKRQGLKAKFGAEVQRSALDRALKLQNLTQSSETLNSQNSATSKDETNEKNSQNTVNLNANSNESLKHSQKILFFSGSFLANGITSAFKNLLAISGLRPYLAIEKGGIEADEAHMSLFKEAQKNIIALPKVGTVNLSLEEANYFLDQGFLLERSETIDAIFAKIWQREWRRLYGDTKFDLLVNYDGYNRYFTYLFAYAPMKKFIYAHNDMLGEFYKKFPYLRGNFYLYKKYDKILSVSAATSDENKANLALKYHIDEDKFAPLPNFINSKEVLVKSKAPLSSKEKSYFKGVDVFINLARLSIEKDQKSLIKAFVKFHAKHKNTRLLILGEGPSRESLEHLIKALKAKSFVHLLGFIPNPYKFLKHSQFFVLSSKHEGQPLVLAEAMILEKPIVCTNFTCAKDFLYDDEYGLVVEKGEDGILNGLFALYENKPGFKKFDVALYNEKVRREFEAIYFDKGQG